MSDAFYLPDGDAFVATELTRGPWSPTHQHAGPPTALLGRAIARIPSDISVQIARLLVEVHRPIPIGRVRVEARFVKLGGRVRTAEATLEVDGQPCARALALLVRVAPVAVPPPAVADARPPSPEGLSAWDFPLFGATVGYHTAVDGRVTAGAFGTGHLAAWMRLRAPLVAGETTTPLERALTVADAANGLSAALDLSRYTFMSADLTVQMHRFPAGEWIHMDARTRYGEQGIGAAEAAMSDEHGQFGRVVQSLVIESRR